MFFLQNLLGYLRLRIKTILPTATISSFPSVTTKNYK